MRYIGRISASLFAGFAYFYWTMKLDYGQLYDGYHFLSLCFFCSIAWWIGRYYDENRHLNEELNVKKDDLQSLLDNVDAAIWSIDHKYNQVSLSKGFEKIIGIPIRAIYEDRTIWRKYIYHEDQPKVASFLEQFQKGMARTAEFRIITNQQIKWIEVKVSPIRNEKGDLVKTNGVILDITERKKAEKQIKKLAYTDSLTGLLNRTSLFIELNKKMQDKHEFVLLIIDFDRFKTINDAFGHLFGDLLLEQAADRLTMLLEKEDSCQIYRYGSDEFWVICPYSEKEHIAALAEKIVKALSKSFSVSGQEVLITPSIGISTCPHDTDQMDTLLVYADSALGIAKEKGRSNYQFFNSELYDQIQRKTELERELRKAIQRRELFLHYQPQVDMETNEVIGFEALIRWKSQAFGLVPPSEFIPIAEESGLISDIGEWVIKEACLQSNEWKKKGYGRFQMSVNISVKQFQKMDFVDTFKALIQETKMDPNFLQIEITESIMQNTQKTKQILARLKVLGIRVSIDDFGTGYSSLSVLKELPLDCLKIDQSFVRDVTTSKKEAAIVKNIIDLAHNLELSVVAEGVETVDQLLMLQQLGCRIGQGYLFSRPLSQKKAEELIWRARSEQGSIYKINA